MEQIKLTPLLEEGFLQELYVEEEISSTNDLCKELFLSGKRGSILCTAEVQTKGRGRMGRFWSSPRESGIWMSLLYTPERNLTNISALTLLSVVAVRRAIQRLYPALTPFVKWPNDLLLNRKKCCGILTEGIVHNGTTAVIFGIGINTAPSAYPPELKERATSLAEEAGCPVDREALIRAFLPEITSLLGAFEEKGNLAFLQDEYTGALVHLDQPVYLTSPEGERTGPFTARGITPEGALLLERPDGSFFPLISGEISVRGSQGYI